MVSVKYVYGLRYNLWHTNSGTKKYVSDCLIIYLNRADSLLLLQNDEGLMMKKFVKE